MKTQELQERISQLKASCIDSVDRSFSIYVIYEYISKGDLDFVISDEDWYHYWLENASEIDDLVNRIQNSNIEGHIR